MNITDNKVINKNILRVKYEENVPFFEIHIEHDLFLKFQTDHLLELHTSLLNDSSLKLTIRLKSFRSTVNFNMIIPIWDKHDAHIHNFLSSFVTLESVEVIVVSIESQQTYQKAITLPTTVRKDCKLFNGELDMFQKEDGLEETFKQIPLGFLIPYANPSHFLLLCKTEDIFFHKIMFVPHQNLDFHLHSNSLCMTLVMSYQGFTFASLRIKKEECCEEIIEDFKYLLQQKKIKFAITNHSMTNDQFLSFSKDLKEEQEMSIVEFFQDNPLF